MAGYSYPTFAPSAVPNTYAHEDRPHVCGKCRNPFTVGNPDCPNARTPRST
jgi:hypothetical protein